MSERITFDDLRLKDETLEILRAKIASVAELINLTDDEVLAVPKFNRRHLREVKARLSEIGLSLQANGNISIAKIKFKRRPGRPRGSRDKNPGSNARKMAGKRNAWRNGNGTHRTDNDRFTIDVLEVPVSEVRRYGELWKRALRGEHGELEEDIAQTMGMNYALYKMIGRRILDRGYVDIPLYALDRDGKILRDDQGRQVLRGIKTPKGELDVFLAMQKSLGIDAGDLNVTAKSQGRQRRGSDKGVLGEIERAKSELDANRERFSRKKKSQQGEVG